MTNCRWYYRRYIILHVLVLPLNCSILIVINSFSAQYFLLKLDLIFFSFQGNPIFTLENVQCTTETENHRKALLANNKHMTANVIKPLKISEIMLMNTKSPLKEPGLVHLVTYTGSYNGSDT